jgi:hypothetical protein
MWRCRPGGFLENGRRQSIHNGLSASTQVFGEIALEIGQVGVTEAIQQGWIDKVRVWDASAIAFERCKLYFAIRANYRVVNTDNGTGESSESVSSSFHSLDAS